MPHEGQPTFHSVGLDTFRSSRPSDKTFFRSTLYNKNQGTVTGDRGLVRTDSPISGNLLLSRSTTHHAVKDPIAGVKLHFHGATVKPITPVQKQQLLHSKKFYLTRDTDITLQILRATTKVNRWTNEKVGTAGTPTGLDSSLKAYKEAQYQQMQRAQQQELLAAQQQQQQADGAAQ